MDIQFKSTVVEKQKNYQQMTVTYKTADGKVGAKKLLDFNTPKEVWDGIQNAKPDEWYSVKAQKNQKGFWDWVEMARQDQPPTSGGSVTRATGGFAEKNALDRERFEFEKSKQILIIRQSCIASAVELCKDHGKQPNPQQVIEIAGQFEAYVLGVDKEPV